MNTTNICSLCEGIDDNGLTPWAGQLLCWPCVDLSLELLSLAFVDLLSAATDTLSQPQAHAAPPDDRDRATSG